MAPASAAAAAPAWRVGDLIFLCSRNRSLNGYEAIIETINKKTLKCTVQEGPREGAVVSQAPATAKRVVRQIAAAKGAGSQPATAAAASAPVTVAASAQATAAAAAAPWTRRERDLID